MAGSGIYALADQIRQGPDYDVEVEKPLPESWADVRHDVVGPEAVRWYAISVQLATRSDLTGEHPVVRVLYVRPDGTRGFDRDYRRVEDGNGDPQPDPEWFLSTCGAPPDHGPELPVEKQSVARELLREIHDLDVPDGGETGGV